MSIEVIKSIRQRTGLPFKDIKKAVDELGTADEEAIIKKMREQGVLKQQAREGRVASEGGVFSYVHDNNKIGVLLQIKCETDFVARSDDFRQLGSGLALHIAAMQPKFLSEEEVNSEFIEEELEIARKQLIGEGKPEDKLEMILKGKRAKIIKENSLITQEFFKDNNITVQDLIAQVSQKTGEKIVVDKFIIYTI